MSIVDWMEEYDTREWQSATDGTVRYALIGLGWWTTDVAIPAIEEAELAETTMLVSSSVEKAERIAEDNDISHGISYEQFHNGAALDAYDAVYIATPNAYHLEYAETAANLGKAVLCEKPMEATVERAERMLEACDRHDVSLMIAYRMQTDPMVWLAKDLIDDGVLGEPVQVYGDNTQPLLQMIPNEDQWRVQPELTGYGSSVMDLGIYSINTTRYLLEREPISAHARMTSRHQAFEDVDDERSSFLLEFEDGVQFVSTASQRAHEDTQLKITGTEGLIELRPAFHGEVELHVEYDELRFDLSHEAANEVDEMQDTFEYFADRLLTDREIYPDGAHGKRDLEIIAAIHESAADGTTVRL